MDRRARLTIEIDSGLLALIIGLAASTIGGIYAMVVKVMLAQKSQSKDIASIKHCIERIEERQDTHEKDAKKDEKTLDRVRERLDIP